jgi:RNA polymerase sigma-70 factor (ECF subfamily)
MRKPSPADELRGQLPALLPKLRRFARVIAGNVHDADDLVQVAIEKALRRADLWQPGTRLESWMFGIMKNAWIDEIRSRSRRTRVHAPEEAGTDIGEDPTEGRDILLSVQSAMARLPDDQRIALALVLVAGYSYKDSAELLGIPIGTLTSRLARGREALASMLQDGEDGS